MVTEAFINANANYRRKHDQAVKHTWIKHISSTIVMMAVKKWDTFIATTCAFNL